MPLSLGDSSSAPNWFFQSVERANRLDLWVHKSPSTRVWQVHSSPRSVPSGSRTTQLFFAMYSMPVPVKDKSAVLPGVCVACGVCLPSILDRRQEKPHSVVMDLRVRSCDAFRLGHRLYLGEHAAHNVRACGTRRSGSPRSRADDGCAPRPAFAFKLAVATRAHEIGWSLNFSEVRLDDSSCPRGSWQVQQLAWAFRKHCERSSISTIKVVWLTVHL
jgi:hypothetical protein